MSTGYICPECHLDYDTLAPADIGARLRPVGGEVRSRLAGLDDRIARTRPEPSIWSAVEYAAHLADAYDAFVEMAQLMPKGASMKEFFWDPDERAIEQGYNDQPIDKVLTDLNTNAMRLADAFDRVGDHDWSVTAEFAWGERDLLTMARNAVHEGVHHTQDIDRVLERLSAAAD